MTLTREYMVEIDTRELELITRRQAIQEQRERLVHQAHGMVGDGTDYQYGRRVWRMSDGRALEVLLSMSEGRDQHDLSAGKRPSELLALIEEKQAGIDEMTRLIEVLEDKFRKHGGWTRYFPCLNADGHIHSTLRGCQTVRWDTRMGWEPAYSGLTPDEAIHGIPGQFEGLGETLCSVCFPDAPAQWCRTRSEVTRAEREAARDAKNAARNAVKAAKNLAEPFRCWDGDRITTVAAAKAVVRRPAETQVELEWNKTLEASKRWEDQDRYADFIARMEHRLEMERADAVQLSYILIAREAAAPGTGWSQAAQDKALADALKRNRKAWFK